MDQCPPPPYSTRHSNYLMPPNLSAMLHNKFHTPLRQFQCRSQMLLQWHRQLLQFRYNMLRCKLFLKFKSLKFKLKLPSEANQELNTSLIKEQSSNTKNKSTCNTCPGRERSPTTMQSNTKLSTSHKSSKKSSQNTCLLNEFKNELSTTLSKDRLSINLK
jgi:hypothetical protein